MILTEFFVTPDKIVGRPLFEECLSILENGAARGERKIGYNTGTLPSIYKSTISFVSVVAVHLYTLDPNGSAVNVTVLHSVSC